VAANFAAGHVKEVGAHRSAYALARLRF